MSVPKSTICCTAAISACVENAEWVPALALLQQMTEEALERTTITYNEAISACQRACRWTVCLHLLDEMISLRVDQNTVTYGAAISSCRRPQQWATGLALLEIMSLGSIQKDSATYNPVISVALGPLMSFGSRLRSLRPANPRAQAEHFLESEHSRWDTSRITLQSSPFVSLLPLCKAHARRVAGGSSRCSFSER